MNITEQNEDDRPLGQPTQPNDRIAGNLYKKAYAQDVKSASGKDHKVHKDHEQGMTMKIIKATTDCFGKVPEKLHLKKKHEHHGNGDGDDKDKKLDEETQTQNQQEDECLMQEKHSGVNFMGGDQFPEKKPGRETRQERGDVKQPKTLEGITKTMTDEGGKGAEKSYADVGVHRFDAESKGEDQKPEEGQKCMRSHFVNLVNNQAPAEPVSDEIISKKNQISTAKLEPSVDARDDHQRSSGRGHDHTDQTNRNNDRRNIDRSDHDEEGRDLDRGRGQDRSRENGSVKQDINRQDVHTKTAPHAANDETSVGHDKSPRDETSDQRMTAKQSIENRNSRPHENEVSNESRKRVGRDVRDVNVGADMQNTTTSSMKNDTEKETTAAEAPIQPRTEGDTGAEVTNKGYLVSDEETTEVDTEATHDKGKAALKKKPNVDETVGDQYAEQNIADMNAKYDRSKHTEQRRRSIKESYQHEEHGVGGTEHKSGDREYISSDQSENRSHEVVDNKCDSADHHDVDRSITDKSDQTKCTSETDMGKQHAEGFTGMKGNSEIDKADQSKNANVNRKTDDPGPPSANIDSPDTDGCEKINKTVTAPESDTESPEGEQRKESLVEAQGDAEDEPRREKLAETIKKEQERGESSDGALTKEQLQAEQDHAASILQKVGMK